MTAVQLEPPLVERNTPPPTVAANRFDPLARTAITLRFVNPEFVAVQFDPPSVETKTPPPSVPTYRAEPTFSKQYMLFTVMPVLLLTHCATDACCSIAISAKEMLRTLSHVFTANPIVD